MNQPILCGGLPNSVLFKRMFHTDISIASQSKLITELSSTLEIIEIQNILHSAIWGEIMETKTQEAKQILIKHRHEIEVEVIKNADHMVQLFNQRKTGNGRVMSILPSEIWNTTKYNEFTLNLFVENGFFVYYEEKK